MKAHDASAFVLHLHTDHRQGLPARAENAVFYTPDGALCGKAEIRPLFEELVADFPPGSSIEMKQQLDDGKLACIVWGGESEKLTIPFATDTLIVRDGKIVQQTFAAQMKAKTAA